MTHWPGLRRVFRLPTSDARIHADVDAELEFHIQGRIDELLASGASRVDAEREARARFGDYQAIEGEVERLERRRHRRRTFRDRLEALMNDLRYAVRTLLRQPLFALVVIATLMLGIGAMTAIFHALDRAVLHPLPFPDADRIVFLGTKRTNGRGMGALSPQRFQFWHDQSRVFAGLATSRSFEAEVDQAKGGLVVQGMRITPEYLDVVGFRPARGRALLAEDFATSAPPVALLTDVAWRNRFGGDANILGSTIQLDDGRVTVVGVLPPSFEVVATTTQPDLLLPLIATPAWLREGGMNYTVIGRLRSGISRAQIDDDMKSVFQRYISRYPGVLDDKYDAGVDVRSFQEIFAGNLAPALWILLGATGFVFVLACANVVNIVLARTAGRQREFAIRSALGSGRGRIVRQVILEMLVLGAISAICAVLISLVALRGIVGLMSGSLLRASQLAPDWRVLTFVVVSGAFATMVIGIGAAVFATRLDVAGNLAASARKGGLGGSGRRLRNMLVTSESALAMVLLSGAGLLITSFSRVVQVDAGFRREGIFTASIAHTPRSYKSAVQINEFDRRVLERLRSTPGILSAAATASLPLKRGLNIPTTVLGHPDLTEGATEWRGVSTDYFRTMDVSLITGRDFTESDVTGAPRVAIVSTSYVKQFLPGENPIGKRIQIGIYKGQGPDSIASEIIGVAPDLRDQSLESKRYRNTVWTPIAQGNPMGVSVPAFVVHASDAAGAANALRTAIAEADARMGTPVVAAMSDLVTQSLEQRRFTMILLATFAAVALALTCIGIYGVASYSVSQRTQEIGVRIALGAPRANVLALIARQAASPAIVGLLIGFLLTWWTSKAIASMLFGIGPRDPGSIGAVALLLALVAFAASYIPARRAARVDPVKALRAE